MPLWLRKFTFNEIKKHYEEEEKAYKTQSKKSSRNKSLVGEDGKINVPAFKNASKPYQGKSSYK